MVFPAYLPPETPAMHSPYELRGAEVTQETMSLTERAEAGASTAQDVVADWRIRGNLTGHSSFWMPSASKLERPTWSRPSSDEEIRTLLLAKKYGQSGANLEDEARLEIVSQRLKAVLHRIDDSDVAQLETVADHVTESRYLRAHLKDKYGF